MTAKQRIFHFDFICRPFHATARFLLFCLLMPWACLGAVNLIPQAPGSAPDYFCTWNIQGYVANYADSDAQRNALTESNMFGHGKYQNWVGFYPRIRGDLYFVMDDSWDVGFSNYDFGTDTLNAERFPTFASSGSEAEKLKKLNSAVQASGWRAVGGWVCAQKASGCSNMTDKIFYTERLRWMNKAGWGYWKVDWGNNEANTKWRRDLTDWAHACAPSLNVEHALDWNCVPFADAFRTYDIEVITSIPVTLNRVCKAIKQVAEPGAKAIVNCEDEPTIGAALGCAIGIMRHPYSGNLPDGTNDFVFPTAGRDVKKCLDEVDRAVLWHRIAPPFTVDGDVNIDTDELKDSWYFLAQEGWASKPGTWSSHAAPARITRGGLPLPTVNIASGEPPFVIASRNPNGVVTIATLPRTICTDTANRRCWTPLADVTLAVGRPTGLIGVFGKYHYLTLTFDGPMSNKKILAQDILAARATDITSQIIIKENTITLPGNLIDKVGLQKATPGDKSDPGMVIKISPR
jgi:hypothetical protein